MEGWKLRTEESSEMPPTEGDVTIITNNNPNRLCKEFINNKLIHIN